MSSSNGVGAKLEVASCVLNGQAQAQAHLTRLRGLSRWLQLHETETSSNQPTVCNVCITLQHDRHADQPVSDRLACSPP